jgi:hypothetical protein
MSFLPVHHRQSIFPQMSKCTTAKRHLCEAAINSWLNNTEKNNWKDERQHENDAGTNEESGNSYP